MERNKDIAFLEAQIYEYVEILGEQRHLTHENVQRKQARTGEEQEEEEEEQISESESEDEENEIIYNPKNLPLGWDGKVSPCATVCLPRPRLRADGGTPLILFVSRFLSAHPLLAV